MSVTELGQLPGFRVGAVGPLYICVFHRTATLERLEMLERCQSELLTQQPKIYALNIITGERIETPSPAVRAKSAALQQRFDATTVASATVISARGLGAVIARGFLAGLALVAGNSRPTEVLKTVSEGVHWVAQLPGAPAELGRPELPAEVEAFASDLELR